MSLGKKVIGATAIVALAGAVSRSFSILSAPILTSILGPEPYGVMALLGSLVSLCAMLAIFGIDFSYTRFGCTNNPEENLVVESFCWRFVIVTSSIVVFFVIFSGWAGFFTGFSIEENLFWFVGLSIILSVIVTMSKTRMRLQGAYSRIAITLVTSAALSIMLTIALAKYWRQDVWVFLIGSQFGFFVTIVMLGVPVGKLLLNKSGLNKQKRKELIHLGFTGAALSAPFYWVVSTSDRWFIGAYLENEIVGIYSFSYNIAAIGLMLNTALIANWRTEATRTYESGSADTPYVLGRLWSRLVVGLCLAWLVISSAGGDIIRLLADVRFHSGTVFVPWIAGGIFFYGISHLASTGLILKKDMKPFAYWYLVGAIISVILNLLLIPILGAIGAAVVQCLSFAIVAGGVMWSSHSRYPLVIEYKKLLLIVSSIFLIGSLMSFPWNNAPFLSLIYKLPVGIVISGLVVYFVAPDWFDRSKNYLFSYILRKQS